MATKTNMKAVIFAGGVGTRLWPMSRKATPKQFQLIIGEKSIFQQTLERVSKGYDSSDIFISTGLEYKNLVQKQAPHIPERNLILEPERRDSLGAVGYATAYIEKLHPASTIAAIWGADHLVEDEDSFLDAIKLASEIATEKPVICKVDVRPTFPSTYNGWVEIGKPVDKVNGFDVYEFIRFVEKPNKADAKKMFRSYRYLINTGYMAWKTTTMMSLYKEHQPKMYDRLSKIASAIGTNSEEEVLSEEYPKIEKDSVDYGVFEKLKPKDMLVIPADIGWTDIGTWGLLFAGLSKSETDNVTQGDTKSVDSSGSLVWSTTGKTIATIGVKDLVVVDAKDAILVCNRKETGKVKKLVELLKEENSDLI